MATDNGNQSQSVTYRTESHSITCHQTQVNTLHLNSTQAGRYLIYLPRSNGRLT